MNASRLTRMIPLLLATALSGAAFAQATAPVAPPPGMGQGPGAYPGPRAGGPGVHPGGHGHGHGHGMAHGRQGRGGMGAGPGMMLLGPGLDRALELVKATPAQRADIRRIAGAARDDLRAMRQDARPRREAWTAAWTAERVDTAAMEAERVRAAAQRDAAGKRMIQAMAEIGAVLQPAQRRALAEHWAQHRGPHRRAELMDLEEHAAAVVD